VVLGDGESENDGARTKHEVRSSVRKQRVASNALASATSLLVADCFSYMLYVTNVGIAV
jgi:energy-converting hydrogenase Eha subunit H